MRQSVDIQRKKLFIYSTLWSWIKKGKAHVLVRLKIFSIVQPIHNLSIIQVGGAFWQVQEIEGLADDILNTHEFWWPTWYLLIKSLYPH